MCSLHQKCILHTDKKLHICTCLLYANRICSCVNRADQRTFGFDTCFLVVPRIQNQGLSRTQGFQVASSRIFYVQHRCCLTWNRQKIGNKHSRNKHAFFRVDQKLQAPSVDVPVQRHCPSSAFQVSLQRIYHHKTQNLMFSWSLWRPKEGVIRMYMSNVPWNRHHLTVLQHKSKGKITKKLKDFRWEVAGTRPRALALQRST